MMWPMERELFSEPPISCGTLIYQTSRFLFLELLVTFEAFLIIPEMFKVLFFPGFVLVEKIFQIVHCE